MERRRGFAGGKSLKIKKLDIIIIIILLITPLLFISERGGEKHLYLIDGDSKREIQMKDGQIKLQGDDVILQTSKDGGRFIESDCPNKTCIKMGWVDSCGEASVCVPNKLALVMECEEAEYDAISQ